MATNPFSKKGFVRVGNEIFAPVKRAIKDTPEASNSLAALDLPLPDAKIVSNLVAAPSTDIQKLNKTEHLRWKYLQMLAVPALGVQAVTLKLGFDCRFTPDFNYIDENRRMVFEDVKGFQRDDALVKIKVAARKYSWARFLIVKKNGSGWNVTEIKP